MKSDSSPGVDIAAAPAEPTVARRERILIIDDEENLRSNLADYLFLSGYTVETAADGKHALEALSSGEYDLVLCDLKLPTIDGSVVIERARAAAPDMAVIVMTGHATVDNAVHALRAGAYDFLRKPFTLEEIERTVENCLEKRRLQRRNAELTESNARLREIERIKDDLLSTVSHEFRTPLAALSGFVAMIDMQGADNLRPDQTEALDAIGANVDRLDAMIANLLALTESHDGGFRPVCEPVRVGEFLDEFFLRCKVIRDRGDFHAEVEEDASVAMLSLDRARFPLVLSNLIDNSFKFARGTGLGRVVFRVRRVEDHVHFEVHDDGVGITPAVGDHVFERFTQADMSSTREFPGAGLGLAVVAELVRAHGGTVQLEPPELGGASVRVKLPVAGP
jgi:signal transduction histidine kinase